MQKQRAIEATREATAPRIAPMLAGVTVLRILEDVRGWPERVGIRVHSGAIWVHKRLSDEELAVTREEHARLVAAYKAAGDDPTRGTVAARIQRVSAGLYPDKDGWTYYGILDPDHAVIHRPGETR